MRGRPHSLEWWIGVVRLSAVPFAVLQVSLTTGLSTADERTAWALVAALAVGAVVLFATVGDGTSRLHTAISMVFDFSILGAFVILYAFEQGTPTRQLLLIGVVAGAIRYGMVGGIVTALAYVPVAIWFEERRADLFDAAFRTDYVTFQAGAGLIMAGLVGWLVSRIHLERENVERRAEEAEELRDELGRRADLLDAANRCARALNSSLDLDEASTEFIRELRGLVPFDRMAIVLAEEGVARVIATSGEQADEVMPPGTILSLDDNVLADVVSRGQTVVRGDMEADPHYAEEAQLLALGVRTRVVGAAARGRARRSASSPSAEASRTRSREHEIELVSLLGRLAASAVQNIRAYESERRTVEELRRLSALAGRLRLARLARAAQPDGGGDRRGPHPAGPLARVAAGPARGVPRPDRRRDGAPGLARRRRARHLAHRRGHVQLPLRRRRRRRARAGERRDGRDHAGRGARHRGDPDERSARPRRRPAVAPGARQPDRQRSQVLACRVARAGQRHRPERERLPSRCGTRARGSPPATSA